MSQCDTMIDLNINVGQLQWPICHDQGILPLMDERHALG